MFGENFKADLFKTTYCLSQKLNARKMQPFIETWFRNV